jgi:hypothetical protein
MSTDKYNELVQHSNPALVYRNLQKYLPGTKLYISTRKNKKYMVQKPDGKWSHFGQLPYDDFTMHKDIQRRNAYLRRALNIKGNWRDDPYSSNMLAIMLLWT